MATYRVVIEKDEGGAWLATVPGVPGCHTYGRSIQQALDRVREALSLWIDDADEAVLTPDIRVAPDILRAARAGRAARTRADRALAAAQEALRDAALVLTGGGLSRRDAALLLGVSHQRVQQLLDGR
jgi:predicted RNase H-like HicB family nuclease